MESTTPCLRPTWVEIDLDAIYHNVKELSKLLHKGVGLLAVVKADAYGHGAPEVSKVALEGGAKYLGVAFLEEGIELRKAGIEAPILLMGYTPPHQMDLVLDYDLTPTVFSKDAARKFSHCAESRNMVLPVHVKVDTGMGRIGLLPWQAAGVIKDICQLPGVVVEGLMTHLASADEGETTYTEEQLVSFHQIIEQLEQEGIAPPLIHAANSAGTVRFPGSHFNLVRPGLSIYGYLPSPVLRELSRVYLKPALHFKSRVVMVKTVPAGTYLSYGGTFCTSQESLIATVPVGYADGFSRFLSNRGWVLIGGKRAPVVGRVCMDYLLADVTGVAGVEEGEEVVIYGNQARESITAAEVAEDIGTIPYEVLCAVSKRVPRWFYRHGKIVAYSDLLGKKVLA